MNLDIGKVLDVSARVSFAVCSACVLLLFFPAILLPFDITVFREKYGIWIFIVFAVSASLLISHIVKYIVGLAKRQLDKIGTWRTYKYILQNLSDEEKVYLKRFFDKGKLPLFFPWRILWHKSLKHLKLFPSLLEQVWLRWECLWALFNLGYLKCFANIPITLKCPN